MVSKWYLWFFRAHGEKLCYTVKDLCNDVIWVNLGNRESTMCLTGSFSATV